MSRLEPGREMSLSATGGLTFMVGRSSGSGIGGTSWSSIVRVAGFCQALNGGMPADANRCSMLRSSDINSALDQML